MSREIKFRAWDKIFKQMIELRSMSMTPYWPLPCPQLIDSPQREGKWHPHYSSRKDLEIMQYIGLKDKNGKEIYEGDIILFEVNPDICREVKFGSYAPDGDEYHIGFYAEVIIDRLSYKGALGLGSEIEVIGNIYENPKLLKEDKR